MSGNPAQPLPCFTPWPWPWPRAHRGGGVPRRRGPAGGAAALARGQGGRADPGHAAALGAHGGAAVNRRRQWEIRTGKGSGRERRARGSSLRGSIGRRRAGRRGSTAGWSFGGQQWRRRPADGPGRWRRGSGASLGGGDPVPGVGWADGGRRVALHGEVRAAALMEAGGASGRASRGPRNSARSEGEREEAKTNLATSTATTGLSGSGGRRRATRGHRRRERRRRSAACCAEGRRGAWQPREVPEESGFGRNRGRARWSWPGHVEGAAHGRRRRQTPSRTAERKEME